MPNTIDMNAVDPDTRAHIARMQRSGGRGAAGLYISGKKPNPFVYAILGAVMIALGLWIGYSGNKPAWATAMLLTAAFLTGGWFITAVVRLVLAGNIGTFFLFDPNRVYHGDGDRLTYAEVDDDSTVEVVGTQLTVRERNGSQKFNLPSQTIADTVNRYYTAIDELAETHPDENLGQIGALAKHAIRTGTVEGAEPVEAPTSLLPDAVRPQGKLGVSWLRYPLIVGVGVALYVFFSATTVPLQESVAYSNAKDATAAEMRDYLLNPNHTNAEHRADITARLSTKYDEPKAAILARSGTTPALRDAFLELLETLRGPETPAVSLSVEQPGAGNLGFNSQVLRERLADGLGTSIGKDLIVCVAKPDGKQAFITVLHTPTTTGATVRVEFRKSSDEATPYFVYNGIVQPQALALGQSPPLPELIYAKVMLAMIGEAPALPVVEDGDW